MQNENNALRMNACMASFENPESKKPAQAKKPAKQQEQPENESMFTKFTNAMKNLFTDTNGEENGRKQNNDLQ